MRQYERKGFVCRDYEILGTVGEFQLGSEVKSIRKICQHEEKYL